MFLQLVNSEDTQLSVDFPEEWMRKLSLIGLLSAAFMFTQIPLSVDYSLDFLNVLTWLNHPVSNPMFIKIFYPLYKKVDVCETTLDRFVHLQWRIFADTHKSSRVIFRCIFGIKDFIKIILSPFSYNMYICILNIFTIKKRLLTMYSYFLQFLYPKL